jgi:hypothetical protein
MSLRRALAHRLRTNLRRGRVVSREAAGSSYGAHPILAAEVWIVWLASSVHTK